MIYHTKMIHNQIPKIENLLIHAIMRGDAAAEKAYFDALCSLYQQRLPNGD
jgi:hypothetical protein